MEREILNKVVSQFIPVWARDYAASNNYRERSWLLSVMNNLLMTQSGHWGDAEAIVTRVRGAILDAAAQLGVSPDCVKDVELLAEDREFVLGHTRCEDSFFRSTKTERKLGLPPCDASSTKLMLLEAIRGDFWLEKKLICEWVARDEAINNALSEVNN